MTEKQIKELKIADEVLAGVPADVREGWKEDLLNRICLARKAIKGVLEDEESHANEG